MTVIDCRLPRMTKVLVALLVLATLTACTADSSPSRTAPPSGPASSIPEPTPSRFTSVADMDPCGILTTVEQKDLGVQPGSLVRGENFDSCSWLIGPSGPSLFDVRLWRRSAGFVTAALSDKSDPVLSRTGLIAQIKQTSVNGRPAFQYRRQSQNLPPGACGIFLAIDDASTVQIEWHIGSPCEGDRTKDQWEDGILTIEAKLPTRG